MFFFEDSAYWCLAPLIWQNRNPNNIRNRSSKHYSLTSGTLISRATWFSYRLVEWCAILNQSACLTPGSAPCLREGCPSHLPACVCIPLCVRPPAPCGSPCNPRIACTTPLSSSIEAEGMGWPLGVGVAIRPSLLGARTEPRACILRS